MDVLSYIHLQAARRASAGRTVAWLPLSPSVLFFFACVQACEACNSPVETRLLSRMRMASFSLGESIILMHWGRPPTAASESGSFSEKRRVGRKTNKQNTKLQRRRPRYTESRLEKLSCANACTKNNRRQGTGAAAPPQDTFHNRIIRTKPKQDS